MPHNAMSHPPHNWFWDAKILPVSYATTIRYFSSTVLISWARGITIISYDWTQNISNLSPPNTSLTLV